MKNCRTGIPRQPLTRLVALAGHWLAGPVRQRDLATLSVGCTPVKLPRTAIYLFCSFYKERVPLKKHFLPMPIVTRAVIADLLMQVDAQRSVVSRLESQKDSPSARKEKEKLKIMIEELDRRLDSFRTTLPRDSQIPPPRSKRQRPGAARGRVTK